MGHIEKLLLQILRGTSDANLRFGDICSLLMRLGFEMRTKGSHHIFRMTGVEEESIYRKMVTRQNLSGQASSERHFEI